MKYLNCPLNLVIGTLSCWMIGRPQLKVFWSVVVSYTIDVMHSFMRQQVPAKFLLHNYDVLKHIVAGLSSARMLWRNYIYVTSLSFRSLTACAWATSTETASCGSSLNQSTK